jgi:hypothetical protein
MLIITLHHTIILINGAPLAGRPINVIVLLLRAGDKSRLYTVLSGAGESRPTATHFIIMFMQMDGGEPRPYGL